MRVRPRSGDWLRVAALAGWLVPASADRATAQAPDARSGTLKQLQRLSDQLHDKQRGRIGQWFCYVTAAVGIAKTPPGKPMRAGAIEPERQTFAIMLKEAADEATRRKACERDFGLADDPSANPATNTCLFRYRVEFSARLGEAPKIGSSYMSSQDGFTFISQHSHFVLEDGGEFTLLQTTDTDSRLTRGRCTRQDPVDVSSRK